MSNDKKIRDWLWGLKVVGPRGQTIDLGVLLLCVARKDEPNGAITGIEVLQEEMSALMAKAIEYGAVPDNQKDIDALQFGSAPEVYDDPEIITLGANTVTKPKDQTAEQMLSGMMADSKQFEDAKFQLMTAIADAVPAVNVDFEAQLVPMEGNKYHIKLKALTDKGKAYLPYLQSYVQAYMRKAAGNA